MKDSLLLRIHPLLAASIVVGGIVTLLLTFYGLTRWMSSGEVMGRVEVSGTPFGGLSEDQALSTMVAVADMHFGRTVAFSLDGATVQVSPPVTGFTIDEEDIVDQIMALGRQGNAAYQFLFWLTNIFATNEIPLTGSLDDQSMEILFDEWDTDIIGRPVSPGAVRLTEQGLAPVYPMAGEGVEREASKEIILSELLATRPAAAELPTEVIVPMLTDQDIDNALAEAELLLSAPIELFYGNDSIAFSEDQLFDAFRSVTIPDGAPRIVNHFDPEVVDTYLAPVRSNFEAAPVDARYVIRGDSISIRPGQKGTRIDEEEIALRLYQAGLSETRKGRFALTEDADPDITASDLEAQQINHLVSSFTTYHPCCENRVTNIQSIADAVDGVVVGAGSVFSLNEYVGQRTRLKGYVPAGTIVGGEIQDTVGGGVSQFATTTYNAVFWGGYEDITHAPHSYYFARYPEGIEATISWTAPDLVFKNNRSGAILIDTLYTGDSVTVRIFGDNDGRTVKGEQLNGTTRIHVVSSGGEDALHVSANVSDRFGRTTPGKPVYRPNPEFDLDQVEETQSESRGWSVTVTRTIRRGGKDVVEEETWTVRYRPRFAVFEVHPCKVPGQEHTCPTTTTTTLPTSATAPPTNPPVSEAG